MTSLSKGGGVIIGLTSAHLVLGLIVFINGVNLNGYYDDDDYDYDYNVPPALIIALGAISMLTSISGFCFGGNPN